MRRRFTIISAVLAASLLVVLSTVGVSAESQRALNVKVMMTGDQEVIGVGTPTCAPPTVCGDSNAVGTAKIHVVPATDTVCAKLVWSSIDGSVWGAHIHGPATTQQAAPIVVGFLMLDPTMPSTHLSGTDSLSTCVVSEQWADAIAADPAMFYVNVHSTTFGPGAIRAQLGG